MILSDDMFVAFGGWTGTSTPFQRFAAYGIAEAYLKQHLDTPLEPELISGTIPRNWTDRYYLHTHVIQLHEVNLQSYNCGSLEYHTGSFGRVLNSADGILHLARPICDIYDSIGVIYTAGLPTGAFENPLYMLGLVNLADLALKQIMDPAALEGGSGDPGVLSWADAGHSETRYQLHMTTFGSSAVSNMIERTFAPLRRKRAYHL